MVAGTDAFALAGASCSAGRAAAGAATDRDRLLSAAADGTPGTRRSAHPGARHRLAAVQFWRPGGGLGDLFDAFVVQPLRNAFEAIGQRPLEAAATLRAGPLDRFFTVALPLAWPGFVTATVLGFAHTVGEFGVVLMIGGNIPGRTRVISVQIYDRVEALEYASAHWLSGGLLLASFLVLLWMYGRGGGWRA